MIFSILAGQIALNPPDMILDQNKSIEEQFDFCLKHIKKVTKSLVGPKKVRKRKENKKKEERNRKPSKNRETERERRKVKRRKRKRKREKEKAYKERKI